MSTAPLAVATPARQAWTAVASLAMCVTVLIAAEFLPVSLLSPIATDLHATNGMAGQAISISGLFAVAASLLVGTVAGRFDRRHVLMVLTGVMLVSLLLIALAGSFVLLMAARALLGMTIGGFWALATATIMRLVPPGSVSKALGLLYTGNAMATAFAAPVGSWLGGAIGWRGVFWTLVPLVAINLVWQWVSLPTMPAQGSSHLGQVLGLLRRRHVVFAMLAVMLTFGGAFTTFTYLRPFLESETKATVPLLSILLLGQGLAGFAGTYGASAATGRHLHALMRWLPLALGAVTATMLAVGHLPVAVGLAMVAWGALNAAIPMCWSTWLARAIPDAPESGRSLLVAAIQLAIMLGGALGGMLLDHFSIVATFLAGAALLAAGALIVGDGRRIAP